MREIDEYICMEMGNKKNDKKSKLDFIKIWQRNT